jgi:hypothetical protein
MMSSMSMRLFCTTAAFMAASAGFAQTGRDTVLKGTTIEVIQSYKPEVKMAPKKEYAASTPPADTSRPRFSYDIPQQALFYTYSSLPLRPLALGKDSVKLPFANYIKAGIGNLSTVLIDAGFGGLKGANYETGFQIKHLSQKGDIENQQTSSSGVLAEGNYHGALHDWHARIDWARNRYGYYGYDHNMFEYVENSDTVKQIFNLIRLSADMQPAVGEYQKIGYHPSINYSSYTDNHRARENTFGFSAPVYYNLDSFQFTIGVTAAFTSYIADGPGLGTLTGGSNSMLRFDPGFRFSQNGFRGHVFIRPTFGKNNITYLLPDLMASYQVPNSQFVLSAGYNAQLRRNTYEELSTYNPYMFNFFEVRQSRVDEVFGSLQTNLGSHVNFGARVSWASFKNMPLFRNDSADMKQFYVVHDGKVNVISVQANLRYQVNTTFSVGLNALFNGFTPTDEKEVWHEPGMRLNADFLLRPVPELSITGYLSVIDGIRAINNLGQTVNARGVFDLGAGLEYTFIPRLGAFININNILNNRYERWLGYPSYGFNIYCGLRLKF